MGAERQKEKQAISNSPPPPPTITTTAAATTAAASQKDPSASAKSTTSNSSSDLFCDFQLFDEHCDQSERFRKTFYYGELPWYSDRPSLALTSLAMEFFVRSLPPRDELRFLDMDFASQVVRNACVTPASVVVAMVYAGRVRRASPQYVASINSCDLFLVSLMVASKFLYDDGADDEVYNEDWAKAADMEVSALNRQERLFLGAINWNLLVRPNEFGAVVKDIERRIALRELGKRQRTQSACGATYTDVDVLSKDARVVFGLYSVIYDYILKVVSVSLVSYCACLLTVAASVSAVHLASLLAKPTNTATAKPTSTTNATCCHKLRPSVTTDSALVDHHDLASALASSASCAASSSRLAACMARQQGRGASFVLPMMLPPASAALHRQQQDGLTRTEAAAVAAVTQTGGGGGDAYSAALVEHQAELHSVLRLLPAYASQSSPTNLPIRDLASKPGSDDYGFHVANRMLRWTEDDQERIYNHNDTVCCLRHPVRCLLTDGGRPSFPVAMIPDLTVRLQVRFWDFLKQVTMSTQSETDQLMPTLHRESILPIASRAVFV